MNLTSDRKRTLLGYLLVICTIGSLCAVLTFYAESEKAELRYHLGDVREERLQRIQSRENTLIEIRSMLTSITEDRQSPEVLQAIQAIDQLVLDIQAQRIKIQSEHVLENNNG